MYYISGLPYSENELYHHGVPSQKWGIRNYQNPDGSLTDLGRQHYGVGPARERKNGLGRRFITYQINKIKARHPWMFTDEQLDAAIERSRNEYAFRKSRDDFKQLNHASNRAKKVVGDIFESSAKNLSARAVNKIGDKLFDNKKMKHVTMTQIIANPSAYTKQEFDIAKALFEGKRAYELHEINRRKQLKALLNPTPTPPAPGSP